MQFHSNNLNLIIMISKVPNTFRKVSNFVEIGLNILRIKNFRVSWGIFYSIFGFQFCLLNSWLLILFYLLNFSRRGINHLFTNYFTMAHTLLESYFAPDSKHLECRLSSSDKVSFRLLQRSLKFLFLLLGGKFCIFIINDFFFFLATP